MNFVVQEEQRGIAHAVSFTRRYADESELVIILGDTIINTEFEKIPLAGEFILGVKEVDDPSRFGICNVEDGVITSIVEKPDEPAGNLAVVGLYYFHDSSPLFAACAELLDKNVMTKGEYQITDALQIMIENGTHFRPYRIEGWYDCGKVETLLETNRILLSRIDKCNGREGSIIIPPCYIDENSTIESSIIGPYVSIARECVIRHSIIENSILNEGSGLTHVNLKGSVVGAFAEVTGSRSSFNISDHSQIDYR